MNDLLLFPPLFARFLWTNLEWPKYTIYKPFQTQLTDKDLLTFHYSLQTNTEINWHVFIHT